MAMSPASPSVCPLCLSFSRRLAPTLVCPRSAKQRVQLQSTKFRPRPAPARKALSPTVSRPSAPPKPKRNNDEPIGPYAGLNQLQSKIRKDSAKETSDRPRRPRIATVRDSKSKPGRDRQSGFHALKMQQSLSSVPYGRRSTIKRSIEDLTTFKMFPLLPQVHESIYQQALRGLNDVHPTPIQRLAIPALLKPPEGKPGMRQFLLAAETGSGKTLAYLLPVVDALKRAEVEAAEKLEKPEQVAPWVPVDTRVEQPSPGEPHPTTGRPRAIVLVPTAELVNQVGALAKSLSHIIKFRSSMINSTVTGNVIRNRLFSPNGIDVLISTPHLLSSIADSDPNILSKVTHLIIDEADSLFDRSFAPLTSAILDRASPSLKQLILVSATIPKSLDGFLERRFPKIERLTTPKLHSIPRRVQLGVVDVTRDPYRGNKNLAAAETIWTIGKEKAEHADEEDGVVDNFNLKRVLVFVNERETAVEVAEYLRSKGINADALNRDTSEQRHAEILSSFTSRDPPKPAEEANPEVREEKKKANQAKEKSKPARETAFYMPVNRTAPAPKRSLPNTKVLVATDLGSRGIDTLAVRHVILYDVPHTSIDFIHRLGRTGRMGRRGRGIVLVGKDDRRDIVREVKDGMFMGKALI
ncbi:MAG: RNA helicase [Vezdaea aestivalis]|nr:MAG: RNA helicase [Vezdaea aestivalis]